jgi:hypothetical protein
VVLLELRRTCSTSWRLSLGKCHELSSKVVAQSAANAQIRNDLTKYCADADQRTMDDVVACTAHHQVLVLSMVQQPYQN